ncbi:hypothetical protein ACPVPU_03975 [Sphingomonas sp. CJ99]
MSGLIPAFVAVLLLTLTDRPPMLAAMLADRFNGVLALLTGLALAQATIAGLAAIFAASVHPMMNDDAQRLLIGIALILAGLAGVMPLRQPGGLDEWRTGPFVTGLLGGFSLSWGDRAYFMLFAIAASAPSPWPAALGGWLGAMSGLFVAMAIGAKAWARAPVRPARLALASLLVLAGAGMAISALM